MGGVSRRSMSGLNLRSIPGNGFSGSATNSVRLEASPGGLRATAAGASGQGGLQRRPPSSAGGASVAPRNSILAAPDVGAWVARTPSEPGALEPAASPGTVLHHLPAHLLAKVVASRADAGLDPPQEAASQFAALCLVNQAFRGAAQIAIDTRPEISFVASAARLSRAARDAMQDLGRGLSATAHAQALVQARNQMAAILQGLDHVRVVFDHLRSHDVAAAVVEALAGHGGLRGLEVGVPADFPALPELLDLLATRPGILRSLELKAPIQPDAPAPGLDPGRVVRVLEAQRETLTALSLSHTGLALNPSLSRAMATLPRLQRLDLSGMPLGSDQTQALADTLRPLRLLETLDLSHCQLDVAACEHLAGALGAHPKLGRLNLGSNLLGDTGALVLGRCLATLARLESLDLSNNDIGLEGGRIVAAQLVWRVRRHEDPQAVTSLRHLSLADNALGDATIGHLARALKAIPMLRELNLGGCQIGPAGMGTLASALQAMTQLQALDLRHNHLDHDGHMFLADALPHLPSLQDLKLQRTGLDADGLGTLAEALAGLAQLRTLDLSSNALNREGCMVLAPALKKMTPLQNLNLAAISPDAGNWLEPLAPALRSLPGLQHLDLSLNACPDGSRLPRVLDSLSGGLKTLGLERMQLPLETWSVLAPILGYCTELRELNLGNNHLTSLTAGLLAPALAGLPHLEELGLQSNAMCDSSLSTLLSALGGLRKLRSVRVSGNQGANDPNALQGALPHVRVN